MLARPENSTHQQIADEFERMKPRGIATAEAALLKARGARADAAEKHRQALAAAADAEAVNSRIPLGPVRAALQEAEADLGNAELEVAAAREKLAVEREHFAPAFEKAARRHFAAVASTFGEALGLIDRAGTTLDEIDKAARRYGIGPFGASDPLLHRAVANKLRRLVSGLTKE